MKAEKEIGIGIIGQGYSGKIIKSPTTSHVPVINYPDGDSRAVFDADSRSPIDVPINHIISKINEATDSIRAFTQRISATATDLDILRSTLAIAKYPKKSKHSKAAALRFKARHKK